MKKTFTFTSFGKFCITKQILTDFNVNFMDYDWEQNFVKYNSIIVNNYESMPNECIEKLKEFKISYELINF